MALDKFWDANRQFIKDRRGATNAFGLPEAVFVAKDLSGNEIEIACDLDLHAPVADGTAVAGPTLDDCLSGRPVRQAADRSREVLLGVQFLCPRCQMSCYVPTKDNPNKRTTPREIIVHWDKPYRAQDGIIRPRLTIVGEPLKCDYYTSEITGISNPGRCGWAGVIEDGRAIDHSPLAGRIIKV